MRKRAGQDRVWPLMLLAMLLLAGCGRLGTSNNIKILDDPKFHTGYGGMQLSFTKGMPPSEVWSDTSFVLGLEVRNTGAWAINYPVIALSGFSGDYFTVTLDSKDADKASSQAPDLDTLKHFEKIEGRDFATPDGGRRLVTWSVTNKGIPYGDSYDARFIATACYGYVTEAGTDICVDPQANIPYEVQKRACQMKPVRLAGGSGAPIAVTNIDPEMLIRAGGDATTKTLQLRISIENKGNGGIRDAQTVNAECAPATGGDNQDNLGWSSQLGEDHFNTLLVWAEVSGQEIDCDLRDPAATKVRVKYTEDGTSVICQMPVDSADAHLAPVTVYVKYGYVVQQATTVRVKRLFQRVQEVTG